MQKYPFKTSTSNSSRYLEKLTKVNESEDEAFKQWKEGKRKLHENIKQVCSKYGESVKIEKSGWMRKILYDPETKLMFCRNAKVGTSTWLAHFLSLHEEGSKRFNVSAMAPGMLHGQVPKLFKPPSKNIKKLRDLAEESISFSMVRHPFERLASYYQNRIDRGRKKIVEFKDFIQEIITDVSKDCKTYGKCNVNVHCLPFISRCGYCDIPFKIIAKAESFSTDRKFIGRLANVNFTIIENNVSSGGSTKLLAAKYFSELDLKTIERLYQIYKADFDLFGYSPDEFFKNAKQQ